MGIAPIHLNDDGVIFPVYVDFLDLPFSDMWYMVEENRDCAGSKIDPFPDPQ